MLVVGAPLAALAENEWGTGIRVHQRKSATHKKTLRFPDWEVGATASSIGAPTW